MIFQWKGHDAIISQALDDSLLETSSTRIRGFGDVRFMRIGNACETPNKIWHKHLKQPRRVHPPTKLASRENTRIAAESIAQIIKTSPEFENSIELHLNYNS